MLALVAKPFEHVGDHVGDVAKLLRSEAAGGPGRGADPDSAGLDRGQGIERDTVLVASDGGPLERLVGQHAWTEDPPSRTRRFVTNIWVSEGGEGTLDVVSYLLLFRSRLDVRPPDLVSAERADVLRRTPGGLRLRSRRISVDEAVLRTQNLAVFL